jgi:N-acetylmuramoyl-L-alanine amidase
LNFRPLPALCAAASVAAAILLGPIIEGRQTQNPGTALTVLGREGRRTIALTLLNDQEFVGLDDLAAAFQLSVQESLGAITVSYKGKTIILTPDQTLASVAGRLISLPAAPARAGRRWIVPAEFISRALAPIYDVRLELRKPSHLLIVGDLRVPRLTVRYEPVGAAGRLTIDANPRASSTVSQENERIVVRFDADALDLPSPLVSALPAGALVQSVRPIDPVTLGIDLAPRTGGIKATTQSLETATRLTIDVLAPPTETASPAPQAPGAPPAPGPPPAGAPPSPPELPPAFGQHPSPIRTVAIDPGHGGEDDGVKGPAGTKEKDITLSIARRVKAILEARLGVRVLLTREDDRNVPIDDRTAMANNNKADLFISLHANGSLRRNAAGLAIFSAAFDKEASESAGTHRAERLPAFGGGLRDVEMVPWDLAQTRHVGQSTAFADTLRQQLQGKVPFAPHPTDRAPLRILESANMPAVLVEVGYLSNPDQEKAIASDGFQGALVQALYDAVVRYRDSLQNEAL